MYNNSPIGIFDSGLGGLTVWREVVKLLPHESVIYYGDGKNCPYGDKTKEEVITIVDDIVAVLIEKNAKVIVVACNAATASAIDFLRVKYKKIKFIGMEPAVKPAALASKTGVIGILATRATLNGRLFENTAKKYSDRVKIVSEVGRNFVEIVEEDMEDTPEAFEVVERSLKNILKEGADQIVLGCTHYPFLSQTIQKVIGDRDVTIIDPAPAVAQRVKDVLSEQNALANENNIAEYEFLTSHNTKYKQKIERKALSIK